MVWIHVPLVYLSYSRYLSLNFAQCKVKAYSVGDGPTHCVLFDISLTKKCDRPTVIAPLQFSFNDHPPSFLTLSYITSNIAYCCDMHHSCQKISVAVNILQQKSQFCWS